MEAAIRSGADAVAVHLSTDGESEAETVSAASRIADAARQMGLPVLVAAYSRPRESIAPDHVRAVRVAVEIGADIIKSADPGRVDVLEQMCQVVGSAPILLASGGPLADAGASEIVHRLASAPRSVGLCFGRAVTASSEPRRVVRLLRDVQQGGMY